MAPESGHNILIIDDQEDTLAVLAALLRKCIPGLSVQTAPSGREGLSIARSQTPDIIILDIRMPEMDGYQVCSLLKKSEATRHIPVIMVTGFRTDAEGRAKALETGADAFLGKPFDRTELKAQVRAMLRIKSAEDQLRKEKYDLQEAVSERTLQLENEKEQHLLVCDALEQYADIIRGMQLGLLVYHLEKPDDDTSLRMTHVNPAAEGILGIKKEDMVGKTLKENFPGLREKGIPTMYTEAVMTGIPLFLEDVFYGDDRVPERHFAVRTITLPNFHLGVLFEDVTRQRMTARAVEKSLKEKELLLREVHHRIKNNLAMVSSLLNMQSRCLDDPRAQDAFKQSRKRIQSIALLHEKLYRSSNIIHIPFGDYVTELTHALVTSAPIDNNHVKVEVDINDIYFSIDNAIPLGLIITELVTNALKYGKPSQGKLEISVSLEQREQRFLLTIEDSGAHFDPELDWKNTETLGLQLVIMLVEQLVGEITLDLREGTAFTINFPIPKPL